MTDEITQDVDLEQENNDTTIEDTSQDDLNEVDYKTLADEKAAEAAKWKAIATRNRNKKPLLPTTKKEPDDEIATTVKRLASIEDKRQFGYEHGLSPEETDSVFKFASGKPTKETLEHPFVKAGIESLRASKRVADNTPSSSSRSMTFQGKEFKDLTEEDRAKAFEERTKAAKK